MKAPAASLSLSVGIAGIALSVACGSSTVASGDGGVGASSSGGSSSSSGSSSGASSSGASSSGGSGSDSGSDVATGQDAGAACGTSLVCTGDTPVCCADEAGLSCVAPGACQTAVLNVSCGPTDCAAPLVCCGSENIGGFATSCAAACTGGTLQLCDTTGAGPACPAGIPCTPLPAAAGTVGVCFSLSVVVDAAVSGD